MDRTAADNYRRERRGNRLQWAADALCHARRLGGFGLAAFNVLNPFSRTWLAAGATLLIYSWMVCGRARLPICCSGQLPPRAKKLDQSVDKQTHAAIAGSQAVYAYMRGQWIFGSVILGNLAVQSWRDSIVNNKRELAERIARATGEPIHTGSIPSSQRKLAAQAAADIGTQSPLAELASGRAALGTAHFACTGLSIRSGAEVLDQLNAGIKDGLKKLQPHDPVSSLDETWPDPEGSELWHELSMLSRPSRSERLLGRFACMLGHRETELVPAA